MFGQQQQQQQQEQQESTNSQRMYKSEKDIVNPTHTNSTRSQQFVSINVPVGNESVEMKESLISIELPSKSNQQSSEEYDQLPHPRPVKFRSQTQGPRRPNTSNYLFLQCF